MYKMLIEYINDGDRDAIEELIEQEPKKILGEYISYFKYLSEIFLGLGGLGFALLCNNGKEVVKFTVDKTEYKFAINANNFKNYNSVFVNVYNASKLIENDKHEMLFVIHKEYAITLDKLERKNIDILKDLNHIGNEMHDKLEYYFGSLIKKKYPNLSHIKLYDMVNKEKDKINYRNIFQMLIEKKYPTNEIDLIIYNCMLDYINWFSEEKLAKIKNKKLLRFVKRVYELAKEDGIFFYDFKSDNIGKRNSEDGEYCVFDFGHIIF